MEDSSHDRNDAQIAGHVGEEIIVVSGLPRSGASLMMQMLAASGIEPVTDRRREADADNPRGYFEIEAIKQLRQNASWLADATLTVRYASLFAEPLVASQSVGEFLGGELNIAAMAAAVDPMLYRNRIRRYSVCASIDLA